ncbi:MAG: glutamine synthetase, partial [Pseudomonadota bacterium]
MGETDFSLPEGCHTVVMGLGDANGIMRGKRIPAGHWDNICKNGNAYSVALFAIDMLCDVWDTPYVNFDNGYPDFHMFPLTKPVASPWEDGVAYC